MAARLAGKAAPGEPTLNLRQFVFAPGQFLESVPTLASLPQKSKKGLVVALVHLESGGDEAAAERLRAALVNRFNRDRSGSITSTLRRAIQAINEDVYAENQRSILADRRQVSLGCVVLRDDDVYVALAGRALCFTIRSGSCERHGRGDPRPGERSVDLLGREPDVAVDLFHRSRSELTDLILATPGFDDLADGEMARALAEAPATPTALIRALGRRPTTRRAGQALVLSFRDEPTDTPDVSRPLPRPTPRPSLVRSEPPEPIRRPPQPTPAVPPTPPPRPPGVPAGYVRLSSPAALAPPAPPAKGPTRPPPSAPSPAAPRREPPVRQPPIGGDRSYRGSVANEPAPKPDEPRRLDRPGQPPRPRAIALPTNTLKIVLLTGLTIGLFLVGYAAIRLPAQIIQNSGRYAAAISTMTQAEQRERDALAQNDPLVRRQYLDDARRLADQATAARPDSPAIATSTARIHQEYQTAVGTLPLTNPIRLVELPTAADQLALQGDQLAALDRSTSTIYLYLLNADRAAAQSAPDPILLRKGSHVGPATVGTLSQVTWVPATSARPAVLLALDQAGFLVEYKPAVGLSYLALPDPRTWSNVSALTADGDSLYVLRQASQSLTRYPPQGESFDTPAYSYFAGVSGLDLSDAANFALAGDLFLLHASGQIQRFTAGQTADFAVLPSDLAPSHPAGFAAGRDSLFVGDPARARIIQLSRSGLYQRSLGDDTDPTVLAGIRDLLVSDDGAYLFVLSGSTVYRFSIPPLQ
jgi:hypothetical protein